ncbi:MAG: tyrosine-protein phosphatase, partial [Parasporobacterium sp.]|nr:tyrosine-protein phosphatase [Parasporobacterium sp.]
YDVIREDYMMTNIEAAAIAEEQYRKVLERGGPQKEADFEYDANIARKSYLDGAFDTLMKRYGNAITFLQEEGGVALEEIETFKKKVMDGSMV